ncbi:MAG: N(2)-acetyl-L-2,4-diaminobutanoate deacetylase DoeB [Sneathiella sp.]
MENAKPSLVKPTVDFEKDGIQHGFLKLPHSRDESAWGAIMIPITVVRNGEGPVALITGANHGDEYEGPIAIQKLALSLKSEEITGSIILVPALNFPAFLVGARTSPIDSGNMNRTFPGKVDGTVTEKIADYFQRYILPKAQFVLDIHAGGKTLDFLPFAAVHVLENKEQQKRCVAAMEAFNAPYSMMMVEIDNVGMLDTAAEEMGRVFVSTELGGGGSATRKSIEIAETGIRNFLIFAGILQGELQVRGSVLLDMENDSCFITSLSSGLLEFCHDIGEHVRCDDVVARVYNEECTGAPPLEYRAEMNGILAARHFPGQIKTGDCLAVLASVKSGIARE